MNIAQRLRALAKRTALDGIAEELVAIANELEAHPAASAVEAPEDGREVVAEPGTVYVDVSGFTGTGKSAVAGEIEIAMRAIGLQVEWVDGQSEKNMTGADWTHALEMYKPSVVIREHNIPSAALSAAQAGKGGA